MTVDLTVLSRIPIARTGTHETSVGDGTFTPDDLQAMVAAQNDPAVKTARTLLGHSVVPAANGTAELIPRAVVGRTDNLQIDGDTLYADIHVPKWMADIADIALPSRSIEALRGVKTPTGDYSMVLTGLALLSDELPAVESLEDLQDLWARTDPAAPDPTVDAPPVPVAASRLVVCTTPLAAPVAAGHTNAQEGPMADNQPDTPDVPETPAPEAAETPAITTTPDTQPAPAAEKETEAPAVIETPKLEIPDGFKLIEAGKYAEFEAGMAKLNDFLAEKADADAAAFADEVVAARKAAKDSRDQVIASYKANPDATRAAFDLVPDSTPPVGSLVTASREVHDQPVDDTALDLSLCTPAQIAALKARGVITENS